MNRRRAPVLTTILAAAALGLASFPAASTAGSGAQGHAIAPDPAAPVTLDFTLSGLNGDSIRLSQWRGRPVVIDFWATWCKPCRRQIPELKSIYSKYHKSRGLMVLGVACDTVQGDGVKAIKPFVKEFSIDYPIALAEDTLLDELEVDAIPTTIFVAPDGTIAGRMMGSGAHDLAQAVSELLATPTSKANPGHKPSPAEEKKANLYNVEYLN